MYGHSLAKAQGEDGPVGAIRFEVGNIGGEFLDGGDKGEHGIKGCSVGRGASIDMNSAVSVFTCSLAKGVFSE